MRNSIGLEVFERIALGRREGFVYRRYPAHTIPCDSMYTLPMRGPAKQPGTNHKIRLASTRRHHNSVQCKLLAERFDASASAMNLFIELDDRQRTPQKWEMSIKSPSLLYLFRFRP